ncbi:MAG TPA: thioredoxin family protein [Opitutaceae bacterium]|nr:thioredoxin family protein [Opitutaceae bacterium]
MKTNSFNPPAVVSPDQWLAARREFLREEKEFTKLRDRLAARRRELPWVKVDKAYTFESPAGPVSLADLFEGRSQLVVYHFMFGPGWEEGCKSCSYVSDHLAPAVVHLQARDVAFAAVSHAPLAELAPFQERMGWGFNWVSSHGGDFNYDYHVSFTAEEMARGKVYYNYARTEFPSEEAPGLSVFARTKNGDIYHTYSTYSRGLDALIGTYTLLDLVPKGRDEDSETTMSWVRFHDRYDQPADAVASH